MRPYIAIFAAGWAAFGAGLAFAASAGPATGVDSGNSAAPAMGFDAGPPRDLASGMPDAGVPSPEAGRAFSGAPGASLRVDGGTTEPLDHRFSANSAADGGAPNAERGAAGADGGSSAAAALTEGIEPDPVSRPAQSPPRGDAVLDEPFVRRGGFSAGVAAWGLYGVASGFPNDLNKINQPEWKARVAGFGPGVHAWVGGSLTDWFTFAVGFAYTQFEGNRLYSSAWSVLFRLEAFPLFGRGGIWRDLGLSADFGTGSGFIRRKSDSEEFSFTGSLSIAGVGAFWEAWRIAGDHIVFGPYATWHHQSSDALTRNIVALGLRGVFYTKP